MSLAGGYVDMTGAKQIRKAGASASDAFVDVDNTGAKQLQAVSTGVTAAAPLFKRAPSVTIENVTTRSQLSDIDQRITDIENAFGISLRKPNTQVTDEQPQQPDLLNLYGVC